MIARVRMMRATMASGPRASNVRVLTNMSLPFRECQISAVIRGHY